MMLDHLGYPEWASSVMRAIESVLAERSVRTPDLGGTSSTDQMCDAVLAALEVPGAR